MPRKNGPNSPHETSSENIGKMFRRVRHPEQNRKVGEWEETKALNYFLQQGWKLLKRNYRCRLGEIDLILQDEKNRIVFVEVKYRSSFQFGTAQSAVTLQKQTRLIKTALFYIKENHLQKNDFRFDVAAITPDKLEHIPDAFPASGYTF